MRKRFEYVRSLLSKYEKKNSHLDLGCNRFKVVNYAIGLDINPYVEPDIVGSCLDIPYPPLYFNVVTALELIEHFNDKDQDTLLNEVYRVLKKSGKFIISIPNLWPNKFIHDILWNISHYFYAKEDLGGHINELSHKELKTKLEQHKFKILSEKAFSFFNYVVECEKFE